ncbi:AV3 protein [Hedyotis uncinella yellow mosaic virus]|uniref:AV3 protein n=1 Tax=Hedyotis uncinella yellow mosaic virus TaxID=1428190 RepID=S5RZ16_9GEMI|nr:AV3 protein [Hedyotis uncinella yellow mosaic virus]AGS12481.1 AV3 protein [Hedyotis uncinella yellow mosaic virus]
MSLVEMGSPIVLARGSVSSPCMFWVRCGWMRISRLRITPIQLCFLLLGIDVPLGLRWISDRFLICMIMSLVRLLLRMILGVDIRFFVDLLLWLLVDSMRARNRLW